VQLAARFLELQILGGNVLCHSDIVVGQASRQTERFLKRHTRDYPCRGFVLRRPGEWLGAQAINRASGRASFLRGITLPIPTEVPWLFMVAGCVSAISFIGTAMSLVFDVFAPDWDIFVRAHYPQFTTRNRLFADAVCFVGAPALAFSPLILQMLAILFLTIGIPILWFAALVRRRK
jgi:hypothetical protein